MQPTRLILALGLAAACVLAGQAHAEGNPKPAAAAEGAPPAAPAAAPSILTNKYAHQWIPMPTFTAAALPHHGDQRTVGPARGRVLVLVFLASWCEACQQVTPRLREVEQRYARLNTDFVYVFAHDTPQDAEGFMQEFKLPSGVLASYEALKAYNNPELPTVYVGDRRGWLTTRYINIAEPQIQKLSDLLRYLTAF